MSTSVYRSEQVIYYSMRPVTYFGFYISWSGGEDDSAYPFTTPERRDDWAALVKSKMPGADDYEAELAAALLACAEWGTEGVRDGCWYGFVGYFENDLEPETLRVLQDLAGEFDPSEK